MNLNTLRSKVAAAGRVRGVKQPDTYNSNGAPQRENAAALRAISEVVPLDSFAPGTLKWAKETFGSAANIAADPRGALAKYREYAASMRGGGGAGEEAGGSESGASSGRSSSGSGSRSGGGSSAGAARSKITANDPVGIPAFRSPSEFGLSLATPEDLDKMTTLFEKATAGVFESADKITAVNDAMLRGELPGDVVSEIRRTAAEKALKSGSSSDAQYARNLRARDLGLSSTQLQQQGIQNQTSVAEISRTAAALTEAKREFDQNYALNTNQFLDTVRRTDLTAVGMEQSRQMFNAQQNLTLISYIAQAYEARGRIQASLAAANIDPSGVSRDFTQLIAQMDSLLV